MSFENDQRLSAITLAQCAILKSTLTRHGQDDLIISIIGLIDLVRCNLDSTTAGFTTLSILGIANLASANAEEYSGLDEVLTLRIKEIIDELNDLNLSSAYLK